MKTIKEAADNLLTKGQITRDEYDFIEKSAAPMGWLKPATKDWFKGLKESLETVKPIGLGLALGGFGAMAGKEAIVDPLIKRHQISASYDQMSEKVPQLAEKDQEKMKDYFNVVKTFSPTAASNPLVAGALVNKMMEFGGVDHKLVQDLSSIESGLARPSVVQAAGEAAAKTVSSFAKGV